MRELNRDNLLRSWKEISAHLGCDVRTCHRWEQKLGMPVHRVEAGETKSPVFAYKDELDRWFRGTFTNSDGFRGKIIVESRRSASLSAPPFSSWPRPIS